MKKLSLLQLLAIAVLMAPNCATDDVAKDDVEAKPGAGIIVDLPEWTYTKANDMECCILNWRREIRWQF